MKLKFLDSAEIAGTRKREDGYLVVDARIARTGIQQYLGAEVGRPEKAVVNVYRPPSEVFSADTMKSFAHRPVTDDHPSEAVTAENWKEHAGGQSDGQVARDGQYLRVPLMVADAGLIKKIEDGKRELSAGYTCDLKWQDGVTPEGEPYEAIQTNIRANHVAVVERGRAGKDCRIGDQAAIWGVSPSITANDRTQETTMKITVDGLLVETTDAGAQAVQKLLDDRAKLEKRVADAEAAKAKAEEEAKAELAKKEAELDKLKDAALDAKGISQLVADRVALESKAAKIAKDVKPTGLTDGELKAAVVKAAVGDRLPAEKLKDEHYVAARFDILAEDAEKPTDPFRDAVRSGIQQDASAVDERAQAFADMQYFNAHGREPDRR